ncbi:MAG: hypothetical protein AAFR27_11410 [Pseudomonadota bacterium]
MCRLEYLKGLVEQFGCKVTTEEWDRVGEHGVERHVKARTPIYDDVTITDHVFLISSGIAASFFNHQNGHVTLTRFFEQGHIATNVDSMLTGDYGSEEVIAITDVVGLDFPFGFFFHEYSYGQEFGRFIRLHFIQTLQFDKDLLVCQNLNFPEARLRFLKTHHSSVMEHALKKDIAAFLGITPQAYSRIQRRNGQDDQGPVESAPSILPADRKD